MESHMFKHNRTEGTKFNSSFTVKLKYDQTTEGYNKVNIEENLYLLLPSPFYHGFKDTHVN